MNVLTQPTRTLPRTAVDLWLRAVRLPLSAGEAVLRHDKPGTDGTGSKDWPPALAFDSFAASVRQVVGSLVRDADLVVAGRVEQARVAELREAADLDSVAEAKRQAARGEYEQQRQEVSQRRAQVAEEAESAQSQAAEEAQERKAQAEREVADAQDAAADVEAEQRQRVDRVARAADRKRVSGQSAALAEERRAARARRDVLAIDGQIEATKSARRAKR